MRRFSIPYPVRTHPLLIGYPGVMRRVANGGLSGAGGARRAEMGKFYPNERGWRRWAQALNRAGITETREGSKGGIRLSKKAEEITLFDIFHAIEQDRPLFRMEVPAALSGELVDRIASATIRSLRQAEQAMTISLRGEGD